MPENSEVDDNVLFLAFAIGAIIIESTAANDSDSRWPGRPRFIEFLGEPECRKDPSSRLVPLWQMRLRTTDKKAWAIDWKAIGFSTEQQELARAWTVGEISFVGSEPHDESSSSAPEPQMD